MSGHFFFKFQTRTGKRSIARIGIGLTQSDKPEGSAKPKADDAVYLTANPVMTS